MVELVDRSLDVGLIDLAKVVVAFGGSFEPLSSDGSEAGALLVEGEPAAEELFVDVKSNIRGLFVEGDIPGSIISDLSIVDTEVGAASRIEVLV